MSLRLFLLATLLLPACALDADGDGVGFQDDCDDTDATRFPGNTEVCDGKDNNCNDIIDDGLRSTFYADADGDGFGDPDLPVDRCEALAGEVVDNTDCDDANDATYPEGVEVCDDQDNDCDGDIDEGDANDAKTWYRDLDDDDFGDASTSKVSCDPGDGWVLDDTDCDDAKKAINPDAVEVCDGVDNDCVDGIDTGAVDAKTWYADIDGDLYGDPNRSVMECTQPDGWLADKQDCDDKDRDEHPGVTWWPDGDTDTYGDDTAEVGSDCERAAPSDVVDRTDCDDRDRAIHPGASEIWYDGVDQDCSGTSDYDKDADTYDITPFGDDCDDEDKAIRPGAREVHDQVDNDCDTLCDEGFIAAGDLIVTEFLFDPSKVSDTYGEWFEVYNDSGDDIAICGGWTLSDEGSDSHTISGPFTIKDGEFAVFGRNSDRALNGDVVIDYQYASFYLSNTSDEIVLEFDDALIDEVIYNFDDTEWRTTKAAGVSAQLDDSTIDADDNDHGTNWCRSDVSFGNGDLGTPGSANDVCATE